MTFLLSVFAVIGRIAGQPDVEDELPRDALRNDTRSNR
jgi:hypothetical protein